MNMVPAPCLKDSLPQALSLSFICVSRWQREQKLTPREQRGQFIAPYLAQAQEVFPVPATQVCKTQAPAIPHIYRVPDSLTPQRKEWPPQALSHPQQNICNTLKTDEACTASHSTDVQREVLQIQFHTFVSIRKQTLALPCKCARNSLALLKA